MRARSAVLAVVGVGILATLVTGCSIFGGDAPDPSHSLARSVRVDFTKSQFDLRLNNGQEAPVETVSVDSDMDILPGTLLVSGRLIWTGSSGTDGSPEPAVPSAMRLIVRLKSRTGQLLDTATFNVAVRPDGTVPAQTFPVPFKSIQAGQRFDVSIQPRGGSVRLIGVKLTLQYMRT